MIGCDCAPRLPLLSSPSPFYLTNCASPQSPITPPPEAKKGLEGWRMGGFSPSLHSSGPTCPRVQGALSTPHSAVLALSSHFLPGPQRPPTGQSRDGGCPRLCSQRLGFRTEGAGSCSSPHLADPLQPGEHSRACLVLNTDSSWGRWVDTDTGHSLWWPKCPPNGTRMPAVASEYLGT